MYGKFVNVNEFLNIQRKCVIEGLDLKFQGVKEFNYGDCPERMVQFITVKENPYTKEFLDNLGFSPV